MSTSASFLLTKVMLLVVLVGTPLVVRSRRHDPALAVGCASFALGALFAATLIAYPMIHHYVESWILPATGVCSIALAWWAVGCWLVRDASVEPSRMTAPGRV